MVMGLVRYRCVFVAACACVGALLLLSAAPGSLPPPPPRRSPPRAPPAHTIHTPGCTIPLLTPFDKAVERFTREELTVRPCHNPKFNFSLFHADDLLAYNDTHIWIRRVHLLNFSFSPVNEVKITCCYASFYRPAVVNLTSDDVDDRVQYNPCIYFTDYVAVRDEFVKVTCAYFEITIYVQFFLFAPWKPPMFYRYRWPTVSRPRNSTCYNVIILGIDEVSRLNFHRTMPKTLAFLEHRGSVEMLGYNKVGDNTFPNLVPMLMGIRVEDLKRICLPHSRAVFDNCPFVWESFKDAGYHTAFGEDNGRLGTFNFLKPGFLNTPTDYYIHTFMQQAEVHVALNFAGTVYNCMGNRYFFNVLLDYVLSLVRTLKHSKLFGFFWEMSMSHDYLNHPMAMDDSYESLLKNLEELRYLDRTVLFILSDHGKRHGHIRFTKQGRLEERLPLLHVLVPPSFVAEHRLAYANLRANTGRLTTPFDVHATLSDLADLAALGDEAVRARSRTAYAARRGISLWLAVPENRTCAAAGVDDHWCTCHHARPLAADGGEAQAAATHLLRHLNALLAPWPQCARLQLARVLGASELLAGAPQRHELGWAEYTVTARAQPGGGVFEATLRRGASDWALAGAVSRLNLYGEQSRCVHDAHIKLYCYCL